MEGGSTRKLVGPGRQGVPGEAGRGFYALKRFGKMELVKNEVNGVRATIPEELPCTSYSSKIWNVSTGKTPHGGSKQHCNQATVCVADVLTRTGHLRRSLDLAPPGVAKE